MIYSWTNRIDIPGCNKQNLKFYCLSYYHISSDESWVLNQATRFINGQLFLTFTCLAPILITVGQVFSSSTTIRISEVKNYSTNEKRDIYSTFDTENQMNQGLPIDPFDLMNRLKQAGSMNNATTPSDALDEALNAFDQTQYENLPNEWNHNNICRILVDLRLVTIGPIIN